MSGGTAQGRLVLVGQILVDRMLRLAQLPPRGGDAFAEDTGTSVGGGYNILAAAVRAGMPAVYAGAHGTGPNGDAVRQALARLEIPAVLPRSPDADTGYCLAFTDDDTERTFVTVPGAETRLDRERLLRVLPTLGGHDTVYLSGYGLAGAVNGPAMAALVERLPGGVTVFLDPGPMVSDIPAAVLEPVLARCDWVSCNHREASALAGATDPRSALERLPLAAHTGALLRTGADGCWLRLPDAELRHIPGYAVQPLDSNGAGDAHAGAFLALLREGHTPAQAAVAANAAAAIAVTRRGPASAPTRAEIDELVRTHHR